jgi:signal transduction histidine kinase
LVWPRLALGLPVNVRAVEASAADGEHPLSAAVDGITTTNNGWGVSGDVFKEQFAVFAPEQPLTATMCQFQFFFLSGLTNARFGDFEIDVTSDEKPAVSGRWSPLIPELTAANCPDGVRAWGPTLRIETKCAMPVALVRARVPFTGITGFRLKLLPTALDPAGKQPPTVGQSPSGGFLLTEFRVETDPQHSSNIALGREAYCSRAVPPNLPARYLTDGFFSPVSHPVPQPDGQSAFFELDFGRTRPLDHIVVRGPESGPNGNHLASYRVELLADLGESPGRTQWQSRPQPEGARRTSGGADTLRAGDGEGTFSGRGIRIHNQSGQIDQPQIAEVEVYAALLPQAYDWQADGQTLRPDGEIVVPAGTKRLQFTIANGDRASLRGALDYRWRLAGWKDDWQETGVEGRVVISPAPPAGWFKLEMQARHSDGVWDESGVPVALLITLPWWRNPVAAAVAAVVAVLFVAAVWWRVKATVMRRRLALAEKHLDLHRERLRIARDMHDEMGARLTYIALVADRTRREADAKPAARDHSLADIADSARSSVSALDAIVWAVHPQHDSVGDLADYLSDYAPGYLKAAGIECRLDLQVETPKLSLGLTLRHSLLMAVKEALQNVVRHAEATTVRLTMIEARGRLELSVTDDGRGFKQQAAGVSHSGLDNMRQRLAEAGGICEISSGENGRGARVRFTMPLKPTK